LLKSLNVLLISQHFPSSNNIYCGRILIEVFGVPGLNPPLEKTSYVSGKKTPLIRIVLNGMDERDDINGESYSNTMPPHKFLSNQQIADVLTFVRNSFKNKAPVITLADVKYVRARTRQ